MENIIFVFIRALPITLVLFLVFYALDYFIKIFKHRKLLFRFLVFIIIWVLVYFIKYAPCSAKALP